jgi:hypothetical protein
LGDAGIAFIEHFGGGFAVLGRLFAAGFFDLASDLLDADQFARFEVRTLTLSGLVGSVVAVFEQAELGETVGHDVVIGNQEAMSGDERARCGTGTEAERGKAQIVREPVRQIDGIGFFHLILGEEVEQPQPFVRCRRQGQRSRQRQNS